MKPRISVVLVLCLVPTLGYTSCNEFDLVDVPPQSQDPNPPIAGYDLRFNDGRPQKRVWGASGQQMDYVTDDYYDTMNLYPWGYDPGGMRRLDVISASCFNDPCGYCPSNVGFSPSGDIESVENGLASNGIWLLKSL